MKPSIALCMIVRNEAHNLPNCLASVKDVVQEIWVVDTGSTDDTPDIAKSLGARVLHFDWCDDFSAARNAGLKRAQSDWILVLDADEVLVQDDAPKLLDAVSNENARDIGGFISPVSSASGDENIPGREVSYNIRLFRNKPTHRYEGAIHEQIITSIKRSSPMLKIVELPVCILHHGYFPIVVSNKQKPLRNLTIIMKLLQESPNDYYLQYHAGVCLYNLENMDKAAEYLRVVLKHGPENMNYVARSLKILVIILRRMGMVREALAELDQYQKRWPDYTDLQYLRAHLYHDQGDLCRALDAALMCREQGPAPPPYDRHEGIGIYGVNTLIGDILIKLGNELLAEDAYGNLPKDKHGLQGTVALWLKLVAKRKGKTAAIMELVRKMHRPYDNIHVAEICASAGFPEVAIQFLGTDRQPGNARKQLMRGRCLYQMGSFLKSLEVLRQVGNKEPEWSESLLWQAYCALALGYCDPPGTLTKRCDSIDPGLCRLLGLIEYLIEDNAALEGEELLIPLLCTAAPHVPSHALTRACMLAGESSTVSLELANVLYYKYSQVEMAWQVYKNRPGEMRDPRLEAVLYEELGKPLLALHSYYMVLNNKTKVLPKDYLCVTRLIDALNMQYYVEKEVDRFSDD